jgi:hypothetical protein
LHYGAKFLCVKLFGAVVLGVPKSFAHRQAPSDSLAVFDFFPLFFNRRKNAKMQKDKNQPARKLKTV